jgi:hypothetical protein
MIRMLSAEDKLAEIKNLYYQTSRATIKQDFAKAIELLKSMPSEEERERRASGGEWEWKVKVRKSSESKSK